MTVHEFDGWLAYHVARFTGIGAWLAKFKTDPSEDEVRGAWAHTLADVSLEDAKAATDALHSGDEELPKSFDEHPRYVRRVAGAARASRSLTRHAEPKIIDGEYAYECWRCEDSGFVVVYSARTMEAARDSDLFHPALNPSGRVAVQTTVTACIDCDAGRMRAAQKIKSKGGLIQTCHGDVTEMKYEPFNPALHIRQTRFDRDGQWAEVHGKTCEPVADTGGSLAEMFRDFGRFARA